MNLKRYEKGARAFLVPFSPISDLRIRGDLFVLENKNSIIENCPKRRDMIIRYYVALISILFLAGCATISSMPKSAKDVDFHSKKEGKTGWSRYEEYATFESTDLKTVYDAAKAGLADADFILRKADYDNRVVIGEHGITMYDWNVLAGIYMNEIPNGVEVKVHVEGSKEIGFAGDATGDNWTGKILRGMRSYISKQKQP